MTSRRTFLSQIGLSAAGLLWAERILADAYLPPGATTESFRPIRIRGRVSSNGRGVGGAAISDGLTVVRSGHDGTFSLVSSSLRRFVSLSLPSGYAIPTNPSGTARLYRPIPEGDGDEKTVSFTLERLEYTDNEHAFLLMADPQTQDADDVSLLHREAVPDLRETVTGLLPRHVFGVACGDIMYDRLELFPEYERAVRAIEIPCFQVTGNHDVEVEALTDATAFETFMRHFGPTYYSFDRGEIHYIVLDDVFWFGGYIGYIDQVQLDWLKADLSFVEPGKTVVVFVHIPTFNLQFLRHGSKNPSLNVIVTNRELLYRLLEPYRAYIVCGHMHESEYFLDGGAEIHISGALCGAWWTGPVCHDGTPKGYSIYEAKGNSLSWRYKSLGKPIEHQMRLYPPGSDDLHPDEVIANVWSADDAWSVVWYEDGQKRGAMRRGIGRDPLAVELYKGDDRPKKRSWVEPLYTDHLFYAHPGPETREIAVEATDRWGRLYREKLIL
jgi:hypothetical protein